MSNKDLKNIFNRKFGVVMPWPGIRNAEFEAIERIKIAARNIDAECIVINNNGTILDKNQEVTSKEINPKDLDFILSLHYESPKFLDAFYHGILWNPPKYLLEFQHIGSVDNCGMYDALVSYASDGVQKYADVFFDQYKVRLNKDINFVASPSKNVLDPNLSNPKIFYCGMNWEKCSNKPMRHTKILKDLEAAGNLKIFGPEKFLGHIKPWEGYSSYCGELPFDGKSVVDAINKCGVALVLSSDEHKKYEIVTTRIYEAAAAGAVVIADNNEYIKKEFGDSVLLIDYKYGDQDSVSQQILNHFEWIKNNKEKAIKKAKKLQKIFVEKFCMENQLLELFDKHETIKKESFKNCFAKNKKNKVDVILNWNKNNLDGFEESLNYINSQFYDNLKIIICADNTLKNDVEKVVKKTLRKEFERSAIYLDIYNCNIKKGVTGHKYLLDGEILSKCLEISDSKYVTFLDSNSIWFSDHITTLKRTLEDNKNSEIAYSGQFSKELDKNRNLFYKNISFETYKFEKLKYFDSRLSISSMMLTKDFIRKNKKNFEFLDGYEFFVPAFNGLANNNSSFSYRMTCGVNNTDEREYALAKELQIEFLKVLFKNNFYFRNAKLYSDKLNYESPEFDELKRNMMLLLNKKMLKGRTISRFFAKLFFGKKNWKIK